MRYYKRVPLPTDGVGGVSLRITFSPVAPLGLWLVGMSPGYKHVAPLGLQAGTRNELRYYKLKTRSPVFSLRRCVKLFF